MNVKSWTGERLETFIENETAVEHLHRYALMLTVVKGKIVLDIACGEGYGSNLMAGYAKKVTGVDIDASIIDRAEKKYKKKNLSFLQGSAFEIPLDDHSYDVVVSFETIEHHDQHEKMIAEIKRVLKPGGLVVISSPDKLNYTEKRDFHNPYHVKELYQHEFKKLIKKNFVNTCFFLQKAVFASFLVPEKSVNDFKEFTGNYNEVSFSKDFAPVYLLAVASESELPDLNLTVFTDEKLLGRLHQAAVEKVHQTVSYKLGHLLLWPAMLFKRKPSSY